ncbi:FadR/GntR family transcriptional regulator [Streptomyces sp. FIT100]|uniref:FadR/GntR family transcriptional regulator n=1 Tax=Streptomyces sp. FIT100 TaxID=2837956 RepID=UPI0021C885C6|nr:FadR/GntR family transcriptional regulator [Streptomyces sp. FIT100]UUN25249.1 FadR family transcriptional regulator [Streptomyces sp. FIT100]
MDSLPTAAPAVSALHGAGRRLGPAVVQQLVDDIVSRVYSSDRPMPTEAELCTRFGVSRTVVRESLKLLQDKGLVRIVQGKGTRITPSEEWDLIDDVVLSSLVRHDSSLAILDQLIRVRAALEREMAGAAALGGRTGAGGIRAAYEEMSRTVASPAEFAVADVRFHDAVMQASGNRLGHAIVTSIHDKARTTGRYHGSATQATLDRTLDEHQAILEAIESGDTDAAQRAMYAHIVDAWRRRRPAPEETTHPSAG